MLLCFAPARTCCNTRATLTHLDSRFGRSVCVCVWCVSGTFTTFVCVMWGREKTHTQHKIKIKIKTSVRYESRVIYLVILSCRKDAVVGVVRGFHRRIRLSPPPPAGCAATPACRRGRLHRPLCRAPPPGGHGRGADPVVSAWLLSFREFRR